ncbi:MAG: hypothetical protein ACM3JD_19830 [Rudaea sp.]
MGVKNGIINIVKLLLASLAFFAGIIAGGMLSTALGLQPPAVPAGMDMSRAMIYMLLTSPLLALALALVARGLSGGFLLRTVVLSVLAWIAYTVNTQLEASIFSTFASGILFTIVDFAVPCLLCGAAVAFLFPAQAEEKNPASTLRRFFGAHTATSWAWRLALAAVAFMPIYWLFGSMVVPFTGKYYQKSMYGLQMPSTGRIVMILFVRSVLFLLACFPVIALWNKSVQSLFLSLGFALYVLVGLVYMLSADWMPVSIRLPHAIEILADEFTYAAVLVVLLFWRQAGTVKAQPASAGGVTT